MSDELERLRQKRLSELQESQGYGQQESQFQKEQMDSQIRSVVKKLLDHQAQARLANIRLARPDFARQIEILLIQLYQSGRLAKMNDSQFKSLLLRIKDGKRDTKIQVR